MAQWSNRFPHFTAIRPWDDVSGDELAILMPALAGRKSSTATARDVAILCATHTGGAHFPLHPPHGHPKGGGGPPSMAARRAALDTIIRSQVVTAFSPIDAASAGESLWVELFGSTAAAPAPDAPPPNLRSEWLVELSILAALDRFLNDARPVAARR